VDIGAANDVTTCTEGEEALREANARYRALFNSIEDEFCVFEMLLDDAGRAVDYRFAEVSPGFERIPGIARGGGAADARNRSQPRGALVRDVRASRASGEPASPRTSPRRSAAARTTCTRSESVSPT
jgi:PAS domain-containing protein